MLISLADELDTSVSILLGKTVPEHGLKETDLKSISEKLESINLQFAKRSRMRIRLIRYLLIALCVLIVERFFIKDRDQKKKSDSKNRWMGSMMRVCCDLLHALFSLQTGL